MLQWRRNDSYAVGASFLDVNFTNRQKTIHYSFLDIQHTIRFRDIQQAATTDSDSFRATL